PGATTVGDHGRPVSRRRRNRSAVLRFRRGVSFAAADSVPERMARNLHSGAAMRFYAAALFALVLVAGSLPSSASAACKKNSDWQDGNPWPVDRCTKPARVCTHVPTTDGTACNDSDACTRTDVCQAGACVGTNPLPCSASDQCHVAGTCDPATGACS